MLATLASQVKQKQNYGTKLKAPNVLTHQLHMR